MMHRGDWLAQLLWSVMNNVEPARPLPTTKPRPSDPPSDGRIDPTTGLLDPDNYAFGTPPGPICYEVFIPPEPRIGYWHGERHQITPAQIHGVMIRLQTAGLYTAWLEYCETSGNSSIYRYWPSHRKMMPTSTHRENEALQDAVLIIAEAVAPIGAQALALTG